jgi:hypothetical protein
MADRWLAWCAAIVFALGAGPVVAHTLSVSHVDVVVPGPGDDLHVEIDVALKDVALTLPLDANRDERVTWGELQAIAPRLRSLVQARIELARGPAPCRLLPAGIGTRRYDDGTYATLVYRAQCPSTGALRVQYDLFFDRDPQHRALVTVRHGADVTTGIARADMRTLDLPLAGGSPFFQFLREGIHHILIGYDHLAFLVSLLLTSALVRDGAAWAPSGSARGSLSRVLGIVTAFTLAHSITLSLAALGWVVPASRWVEPAIAGSVLVAALNNVWPWATRRTWLLGFAFGIVHGFGFAGALTELGLARGQRVASLLGFNLGVEFGQLAVVVLLLPVLFALRGRRWYSRIALPAASVAIAGLASAWMLQRIA